VLQVHLVFDCTVSFLTMLGRTLWRRSQISDRWFSQKRIGYCAFNCFYSLSQNRLYYRIALL